MSPPGLRVLIVDDEAPARARLERLVGELDGFSVAGSCATAREALECVETERPAVVLLDIRMPGLNGLEAARRLARRPHPPAVVFTTAYDEHALEAFESQAVGYLLKPVRRERLRAALTHAARLASAAREPGAGRPHVAARRGEEVRLIPVREITFFRAEQKYVVVRHAGGEDLIETPLTQLADELGDAFVRIHRSLLVAVDAIEALEKRGDGGYRVRLRGSTELLSVSRRQVTALKSRLR